MSSVGPGACEIRVRDASGAYRVVYVAKFADAVYVLHAFQKRSKRGIETPRREMEVVRSRLRLVRVPQFLVAASVLSILALVLVMR